MADVLARHGLRSSAAVRRSCEDETRGVLHAGAETVRALLDASAEPAFSSDTPPAAW